LQDDPFSGRQLDPLLEERAEDLYEDAPCGYCSTRLGGEIVKVNRTLLQWMGHERDELLGRRFQDLLTAGGRIYHETHYAPLLRMQGAVREIALELVRADGRRLPVLVNSVLRTDADGQPLLVRTTIFDATHRRGYERELLRAREGERAARRRTERLQRLSATLAAAVDARQMGRDAVAQLADSLGADHVAIALTDPETGELLPLARHGEGAGVEQFGEAGGDASTAVLALATRGEQIGVLVAGFAAPRTLDAEERTFLHAAAGQCSQALERARLYDQAHLVAHTLQQSLLAGSVPRDRRVAVATLYMPAVESLQVGGDWHDAFMIGEDVLGVVVGDVVGRGIEAASAMGQLRSATRALAGAGLGPAGVLEGLSGFVADLPGALMATLVCAELDLRSGSVRYVCAGHPPPLVLQPGAAPELLWDGRSSPLGANPAQRSKPESRVDLRPGGRLVLYTDGLVERRRELMDVGLERLAGDVWARREEPLETLPAGLVESLVSEDQPADDVCLLCLEYRPAAA
jgi:PAS domain S-box-containing protein